MLSWVPPLLIGLKQFHTVGPFIGIFAMLTFFHIVAANLLIPALVGWRVRLNALALTVSLLFWGWLWGAMGLDPGDSDHRGHQGHLRPRGRLAAGRPLAQRVASIVSIARRERRATAFFSAFASRRS